MFNPDTLLGLTMKKIKILYVDSNSSNLYLFNSWYTDKYDVFSAVNEEVAIRMLKDYSFSFVICDQMLDAVSGHDFLKFVRKTWPEIRTVLLTSSDDKSIFTKILNDSSIDHYVHKPYSPRQLGMIFTLTG